MAGAYDLERIPLREFLDEYWAPALGEHTALVGPTGCGKTTVGLQLTARAAEQHPGTRAVVLVMKPHKGPRSAGRRATGDATVSRLVRQHHGRVVRSWPPPPRWNPWRRQSSLYALWPTHTADPAQDKPAHQAVMRAALQDTYRRGDSWVFCDEAAGLCDDLDLEDELNQSTQRGRSMNHAAILATQRPRYVPRSMFTESKHFFLWRMNDVGEYERLREIGGGRMDRRAMVAILSGLGKHECLYMYPDEDIACVLT